MTLALPEVFAQPVASGGFNATGATATFGAASTSGNLVVLVIGTGGASALLTMTGWTKIGPAFATAQKIGVYYRTSAGETSWAFTALGAAQPSTWTLMELAGMETRFPVDVVLATASTATAASISSGTSPRSTTYDGLGIAAFVAYNSAGTTAATFTGYTNSFEEQTQLGQAGTGVSVDTAVTVRPLQSVGTFASIATASVSQALAGVILILSAAGARREASILLAAGAEWGTATTMTTAATGAFAPFESVAGTPDVVTTSPRSGTYCLELAATAAAENVGWTTQLQTFGVKTSGAVRLSIYFPTSLPAGDVELLTFGVAAGASAVLRYRTATQKLGVQYGTGTEVLSANTVTAGTWISVDVRIDQRAAIYLADWQVDGVEQTQAASQAGLTAGSTFNQLLFGWVTAATATVRYDDLVYSPIAGHYPLGDYRLLPLTVDPAGTITLGGGAVAGDFNTFTNNGTMAAWNATTARNAIDEVPPTIGATADGVAQITSAAGNPDYIEIPMTTVTLAGQYSARAIRVYIAGWAASATAATVGFRYWDGTTEWVPNALQTDIGFDASTTVITWLVTMVRASGATPNFPVLTQAALDAFAIRMGFSTDATPNTGMHNALAELIAQPVRTDALFGDASTGEVYAVAATDPDTGGISAIIVTTPAGVSADITYEVNGTPVGPVTVAAGTTQTITIEAADMPTVNRVQMVPSG